MTNSLDLKKINETLTEDLIDKSVQHEKEKKDKRIRERELADIRTVVNTPEGRRFIWRVLAECGMYKDGYVHGDNGYGTTFNTGRKSIGIWLTNDLLFAKPDAFRQMTTENQGLKKQEEEPNDV